MGKHDKSVPEKPKDRFERFEAKPGEFTITDKSGKVVIGKDKNNPKK